MASIELDSDFDPIRSAVGEDCVYLYIDGGWILTGLTDSATTKYEDIQQTYQFNFYTDSRRRSTKITIEGASNNTGYIYAVLYGLTKGAENTITVSITYSYRVSKWNSEEEKWGKGNWEYNENENEGSLNVYTRNDKKPSDLWGNPYPGNYIDEHITQSNVNAWFDQFGVWRSWKEQIPYYNYFDEWRNPEGDIGAGWYNELSKECGGSYRVSQFNEYISAEHFQDLARKVTDWS